MAEAKNSTIHDCFSFHLLVGSTGRVILPLVKQVLETFHSPLWTEMGESETYNIERFKP